MTMCTNKAFVRTFVESVLINGRFVQLAGYFNNGKYLQHHPHIADDLSGLATALQAMAKQGIEMKYDRIHKVLGEGSFVLVRTCDC